MSLKFLKYLDFIILLIIQIRCEDCTGSDESSCSSSNTEKKCKFFYGVNPNLCKDCTSFKDSPYFTLDADGNCEGRSKKNEGDKLINGKDEIVSECPQDFINQLGDICYDSQPQQSLTTEQPVDSKHYICNGNYIIEKKDGFNYYTCIDVNCESGNMYFDKYEGDGAVDSNSCYSSCQNNGRTKIKVLTTNLGTLYQCTDICNNIFDGEYKFEYTENEKTYCLKECPINAKYYVDVSPYTCLPRCEKYADGNKCVDSCDSNKIIADMKNNILFCGSTTECPPDYPYLYNKEGEDYFCLKSCKDTQKSPFSDEEDPENIVKTYLFEDPTDSSKKCLSSISTDPENPQVYYIDENAMKWVKDCKTSPSGPYYKGNKCQNSCGEGEVLVYDKLECKDSPCPEDYYLEEENNICYKTCPNNLGKGYYHEPDTSDNTDKKKCLSKDSNECPFYNGNKLCSSDCKYKPDAEAEPTQYYHNYNDKFCFSNACSLNKDHKYNEKDKYVCYNSCSEISEPPETPIKYEKDYICYTQGEWTGVDVTDYIYYTLNNSIIKYIHKNLYKECIQANLTFLKGSECVNRCESGNKIILPTVNELGKCLSNDDNIPDGYTFFNTTDNIYTKTCDVFTIVNSDKSIVINDQNCVNSCPSNNCEDQKNKLCYTSCSYYYKESETNKKIYVEKCDKYYYEEDNSVKKCVEKCDNNHYYLESGECIATCPKTESSTPYFSYEITNEPQPCLTECPNDKPYYYNVETTTNPKMCLSECDKLYSSENNICTENCADNQFIHPGKICSSESCPKSAPFIIPIQDKNYKECSTSCKENQYYDPTSYECGPCSEGKIYNGGCYSSCPDGLFINGNECVSKCDSYFKKNTNGKYECIQTPTDYITSSNECVKKCPKGEVFIGAGNKCQPSCENEQNKFYEKKTYTTENPDPDSTYDNYICINDCSDSTYSNFKRINGTKECISSCGTTLYEYQNICYESCILNKDAPVSTKNTEGKLVCSTGCLEEEKKYYLNDKVCIANCKDTVNKTIDFDGKTCVNKCDLKSNGKFLNEGSETLKCKDKCENDSYKRFLRSNYICIEKCEIPNNYLIEENTNDVYAYECLDKCPDDKTYYMRQNENGEYICSTKKCGEEADDPYKYYYMDKKICLKDCGKLYEYENYCVNSCDFFKNNKLYHYDEETDDGSGNKIYNNKCVEKCISTEKPFSKSDGHCDNSCEENEFYFTNDKICLSKCPRNSMEDMEDDNHICKKCTDYSPKKYIDENGNCVEDCSSSTTGYKYHKKIVENNDIEDNNDIDNDYLCLDNCGDKKIEGYECVDSCSSNPFINDNNCLEVCPYTKRFYLQSNNICLYDCPNESKYYTITKSEENENTYYKCQDDCQAYVPKSYSNMNATFCFGDNKCQNDYPYYQEETISEGRIIKKCQAQCPSSLPYYVEGLTEDIECLQKCPENTIHQPNSYICMEYSKCTSNRIKYKNQECVQQCSKNEKIFEKSGISYCVDECNDIPLTISDYTLLNTYDNKCVTSCDADKTENRNGFCECKGLYYIDKSTLYRQCLSSSISDCSDNENYKIRVYGSDECTDYCNGVLSSSETICYPGNYSCDADSEKLITYTNGNKICECIDKYYYGINNEGKSGKICLSKNANCPSTFNFLIKETNECVQECKDTYKYTFENTCVSSCDSIKNSEASEVDGKDICKCKYKYYIDKNNNIICLDENAECPEAYPLIIDDETKKHCVSSCIGTGYEYYFNKKCNQDCESGLTKVNDLKEDEDPYAAKYAQKKCRYNKNWYYDEITKEEKSAENDEDNCITLTSSNYKYKYTIFATKQCVPSCPSSYSFIFNNYCLNKCEDYTEQNIKTDNEKNKCVCKEKTEYIENNNNNGIIKCMTNNCDNNNEYSIVEEAGLCYKKSDNKKCPSNYPFYYNNKCYSEKKCPENTIPEPYEQKCICKYKWYEDGDTLICLSENVNCPATHQYIISSTNKCIETNDDANLYEFNYTLYSSCPQNTKEEEKDGKKICVCNPNKIWFTDIIDGKEYYFCAEEKCPNNKIYQNEDSLQCLERCGTDKKVYNGICYDECPNLTEEGNDNNCVLSTVRNDLTMNNVEQTIKENLLDLYKKSESEENPITSSQKIDTPETTIEFYGVNKKNKGDKQDNIKSDLSYIDISECVDKIYKSNGMDSTADIIILKFDIKIQSKYLVNPVEYKFINSKTGQELDASVCEHNSIKISYPLHNLISRYENMRKSRKLEYIAIELTSNDQDSLREKLDKGKEIIQEYPDTDIFNINDKIYSDICIAVEINGKDLILEDRIKFFYPQISICENNCTYNHTDFVNERIYCDCSFKKEFDFKRNDEVSSFEINSQQVNNDQGGNSNIAVLKCISNLNNSKSLSGNSGFIFMLIVIVVEVILFFIIILYGINSVLNKLNNKMKNEEEEEEHDEVDDIEVINIENTNNLDEKDKKEQYKDKDTQRALNAPPKKRGEYAMEFIPQEYVFLFFNNNEKGIIKKVEKDSVPFKVGFNTRILLEKNKNVDYNNIKSRGPFPPNQNVLVIVDDMKDDISDYIYDDNEDNEDKNGRKNSEQNNINGDKDKDNDKGKDGKKNKKYDGELISEKYKNNNKLQKYSKRKKFECTTSDYDPSDENYSELDFDEDENHEKGLIESIKKEQRLLKKDYETALQNQKNSNFVIMLFTEIIDKIYFIKILLFTRKFDILSLQFSVYFLCHTILLIFLALFYDIKTITKIWNTENYPGLGFHLLYGFLACIIVWIIYKIILCLWSNNDKIKEILRLIHANKKYGVNNQKMLEKKCNNLGWKLKLKVAIYTIIQFLLLAFCFIYLVTFCTVYTGTKDKVFQSYGIALIEILIIKILYGIALAILRRVSLTKQKKTLYEIVLLMNTYLV